MRLQAVTSLTSLTYSSPPRRNAKAKSKLALRSRSETLGKRKKIALQVANKVKAQVRKLKKTKPDVKVKSMKLSDNSQDNSTKEHVSVIESTVELDKPAAENENCSLVDKENTMNTITKIEECSQQESSNNATFTPPAPNPQELPAVVEQCATVSCGAQVEQVSNEKPNLIMEDIPDAGYLFTNDLEIDLQAQSSPDNCSLCDKELDSAFSLTLHMKQHSINNQIHKCLVCSKVLSSASSLDRHMLVHSGERPFKCKVCDMAFTTNGNMHRHMRTHGEFADVSDTSKVPDIKKRDSVKRKLSYDSSPIPIGIKKPADVSVLAEEKEKLHCPVCGKSFLCKYGLQSHMESHPDNPVMCPSCGEVSINYANHINHKCNILKTDVESCKPVPCGFRDLTFLDFSMQKFSLVSKSFCEQNIKRPSSAFHVFECSECKKAFPCGRALKLHQNVHNNKTGTFCATCDCDFETPAFLQFHQLKHRSPEHCLLKSNSGDEVMNQLRLMAHGQQPQAGKEDFLALLDLQTKQSQLSVLRGLKACHVKEENFENMDYFVHGKVMKSSVKNSDMEGNNDFADIQSIISLTSKAPLIAAVQSSPTTVRPVSPLPMITPLNSESPQIADSANASPETPSKEAAVQPLLKKDLPKLPVADSNIYSCKICCQKFKTINTLKRHTKLHVQKGSNYSCHLCSYVSVDKSTLIRHLRTHNGERPFQCVICKYAFTTKANCERHVRKRHKKFTKQEIRNFMQYNPNMALKAPDVSSAEIGNSETVCKYCNVDFKFNRVLRHHLRSLHNSCNRKPFSCKICKFGFSTKNNCIRHVLKQHPSLKDKLRSVVIPNSQREISDTQSSESDNPTENTTSDASSVCVVPPPEQTEPLDLNCANMEQPLNLRTERIISETTSNEVVIAAESLVSLSETLRYQNEPLDLAVHPLDLSQKPCTKISEKCHPKPASIYSIPSYTLKAKECNFLDLSTSKTFVVSKEKLIPTSLSENDDKPCSGQSQNAFEKIAPIDGPTGQKQRSFTCIYCSSGFTLKSNMERHIKRKHPEFARPTRSRNFIPTVIVQRPQKQNINMLSDKTRDALRHVLSNKVQQSIICKDKSDITEIYSNKQHTFNYGNHFNFKINRPVDVSSTVDQSLDLSGKNAIGEKFTRNFKILIPKPTVEVNEDDNSADLASVSAVICTANSQQFKQYFEKPPVLEKDDAGLKPENSSILKNTSTTGDNENSTNVSCPYCARKFPWSSSLRRHILTHTGQKPYKCPRCALWFTTKSNCERHLIRKHGHKGDLITRCVPDRPYKCNQCPTSTFSTQGNLRKHFYLKHWTKSCMGMNSKPLHEEHDKEEHSSGADSCSTEAAPQIPTVVDISTQEHSYSQTKEKEPFECNFCIEKFPDISRLAKHMPKHNNVIYMCYLCRKTFPKSDACYNHFKTSHSLVYVQMIQSEVNNTGQSVEVFDDKEDSGSGETSISSMACMVCFQKMSSIDDLQQHIKKHMLKDKAHSDAQEHSVNEESSCSYSTPLQMLQKSSVGNIDKVRKKNKIKNSLLYFFPPTVNNVSSVVKSVDTAQEDGSDLIQNLLGIHDSKIIDEMLVSADSAARLLGVKKL